MGHSALTLPHSSVGIAQVFPGESAGCVCQRLRTVSGFAGGVPSRAVLDDATGAGRRVCERVRTTGPSPASAARIAGGSVVYDEPVDLAEYDRMAGIGEAA